MASDALKYQSFAEIPVEKLNPLLDRQFVYGEQGMLARLILRKGCVVPEHSHANEQITYVLEGALRFALGDVPPRRRARRHDRPGRLYTAARGLDRRNGRLPAQIAAACELLIGQWIRSPCRLVRTTRARRRR
jgi:hypothetical protein